MIKEAIIVTAFCAVSVWVGIVTFLNSMIHVPIYFLFSKQLHESA
jgi:hypothetical protein